MVLWYCKFKYVFYIDYNTFNCEDLTMATDEKNLKSVKDVGAKAVKKRVVKPTVKKKAVKPAVKKTVVKPAVKKKAAKPAAKKTVVKPVVKKKATKPVVKKKIMTTAVKTKVNKKKAAKPVLKKKVSAKKKVTAVGPSTAVTKMKALKENLAELNQEVTDLKAELKSVKKRDNAIALLASQRAAAANKFLRSWDKKANAALEKSLAKKKKKAKKKK